MYLFCTKPAVCTGNAALLLLLLLCALNELTHYCFFFLVELLVCCLGLITIAWTDALQINSIPIYPIPSIPTMIEKSEVTDLSIFNYSIMMREKKGNKGAFCFVSLDYYLFLFAASKFHVGTICTVQNTGR